MVEQVAKGDKNAYVLYDPSSDGVFAVTVAGGEGAFRLENWTPEYLVRNGNWIELTYPVDKMVLHLRIERDSISTPAGYRIANTTVTA